MNQKDKSFDNDSFFEMLESIRDAAGDEKKIYVMLDNARFHGLDEDQKKRLKSLDINLIWNTPYRFDFQPVEKCFRQLKFHYRNILLSKMLLFPEYSEQPLKDSLRETFDLVDLKKTVPQYIHDANRRLRVEANQIRKENGVELLPEIEMWKK